MPPFQVHKLSQGPQTVGGGYLDWWQVGTLDEGAHKTIPSFNATVGWEDLFELQVIDQGFYYSSKDNEFPTLAGGSRRAFAQPFNLAAHLDTGRM